MGYSAAMSALAAAGTSVAAQLSAGEASLNGVLSAASGSGLNAGGALQACNATGQIASLTLARAYVGQSAIQLSEATT
jgi:hypothetical protein